MHWEGIHYTTKHLTLQRNQRADELNQFPNKVSRREIDWIFVESIDVQCSFQYFLLFHQFYRFKNSWIWCKCLQRRQFDLTFTIIFLSLWWIGLTALQMSILRPHFCIQRPNILHSPTHARFATVNFSKRGSDHIAYVKLISRFNLFVYKINSSNFICRYTIRMQCSV